MRERDDLPHAAEIDYDRRTVGGAVSRPRLFHVAGGHGGRAMMAIAPVVFLVDDAQEILNA